MADSPLNPIDERLKVIAGYDNEFKKWEARVVKIIKRYRDDNRTSAANETAKFNILWSNVQTLIPAVYAKLPSAEVSRRFVDNDPVGRVASLILERALDFEIEHYPDFRSTMQYAVEDRFLGGRGVSWVRYDPRIKTQDLPDDGVQITEDLDAEDEMEGNLPEEIEYECVPVDYVHWKDFGHSVARTWEEVGAVWRWVYMTKEALVERFGEENAKGVALDSGPDPLNRIAKQENDKAKICEFWDKETRKVYWFPKGGAKFLDERDDPLEVEGFFPCAKPLYATTTTDTLVPVPDFVLYQDQANELDILSDRIDGLVKSLRVRGVYDASQPVLQRLLTEGDNNTLIPCDKWMQFSEKGGLRGSVDLLPLDTLATALLQCYTARADIKGQIYEITGISDIIRGQTKASETATAQQIKGQYAGLRLRSMQEEVALFATDLIRLKAQVMCSKFQPKTLLTYAAAEQLSEADQQLVPQALTLLLDNPLRSFRIEIAADSLVQIDEDRMKQDRMEFMQAFGTFMQQALPAAQSVPELAPLLMDVIRFGVGAFKQAKQIEGTIDQAMLQYKQASAQNAGQPKPNPEAQKAQAEAQAIQAKAQAENQGRAQVAQLEAQAEAQAQAAKQQHETQMEQLRAERDAQLAQMKAANDSQIELARDALERWKAELSAATQIAVAQMKAASNVDPEVQKAQDAAAETVLRNLSGEVRQSVDMMASPAGMIGEGPVL